tara:strand:- start:294 stop:563 length:270 start_codon:yes stop_codon:yes gene_type:complete
MKTNWKIISDFMYTDGFEHPKIDGSLPFGDYHNSWDWLMPVHKKCMHTKQFVGDDQLRTLLIDAVIDADKSRLYNAVVEFINEYNRHEI